MNLLVAGGARVDAGKTTFSLGLLERTGAVGYKPRAGNDYWYDHDDYRNAVDRGRLFGKDARKLADASAGEYEPEDLNPIHRLWRPRSGSATGILGKSDREFLADRVNDRYVVNGTIDLPESARELLPLDDAVRVSSLSEFNEAMRAVHVPAQEAVLSEIQAADRAVVESYADVARPMADINPDAVAVVEPGRARIYDGPRYRKACAVASGGHDSGQLEERVPDVTELLDPAATVSLPPLTDEYGSDPLAVADAYEHAYDALLGAAFD